MAARLLGVTRTTAVAAVALVIVSVATVATITAVSATAGTGKISGTISDPSGYPLAGVRISLYDDGADEGKRIGIATTNGAGRYQFKEVPTDGDDQFRLEANDPSGGHIYGYTQMFTVKKDSTATTNLTLKLAGIIQGEVSTRDGGAAAEPGTNVYVTAEWTHALLDVRVSAKGRFRLGGLPPGTYNLDFQDSTEVFLPECYDNVVMSDSGECKGATQVTVTAGETVTIKPQVLDHRS